MSHHPTCSHLHPGGVPRFRARPPSHRRSPHASALPLLLTITFTLVLSIAIVLLTATGSGSLVAVT